MSRRGVVVEQVTAIRQTVRKDEVLQFLEETINRYSGGQ